ncbi:drug/metabolite transporter (DMT)-like permease [Mycoplana sp. BE70]|uniref:DMT family transporter n=1 Tax=Mycoplana sp. BE70 TaxID=2817775 RepID=UPI002860D032|nr:DMT family transporter [Mycoplana sp. BE70]MDR6757575.1 drug/metabolite transporter (DMT)-like permease [Mycoplana sp. BE70]
MDRTTQHTRRAASNPQVSRRERFLGHLAMLLFSVLIAGSFSFGRLATQHMDAGPLMLWRYLLTMLVMAVLAFGIFRAPFALPRETWRFLVLGGLIAFYMLTMFIALEFTDPISTGAVFTLMPLLSAGFALLFLGQRTRSGVLIALVIAAIGAVWVIFRGEIDAMLSFDVGRGEIIFFIGVAAHAAYVPLLRKYGRGENPFAFGFWVTVASTLCLLPFGARELAATDFATLPLVVYGAVAYLAVMTTAVTFLLLQYASMRLPAPKVLGYGYLTPSFIIVLEGLLGHGWPHAAVFAGALVTACGLVAMARLPD